MLTQHLVCLQRVKKFSTSLGNGNCKTSTVLAGFDFAADALDEKLITKSQHFIVNLAGTEIGAHMLIILRGSGLPGGRYGTTLSTMKKLNIRLRYGAPVSSMSPEMDAYFLDPVVNGTLNVSASKSRGTEFYWLLPHPVVPIGLSGKQAQLYLRVETTEHIEASLLSKLQLSLLVRFRDCIPEICPPHRGTCSPLQMATGYLSTTCTCRYGYAGDRCEINVLSPGGRLTQAVFLIISNAPGFMAAYLSWRHRFFGLMSALIFSTIASALYHSCDIGYACFYSRLPTAKMVDQFGVLILIVLLVLQQSPLPRYIEPVFIIAWLGPITTTLIRESGGLDSNIDSGALTFIVAGAAAFLVLTWAAALLRAGALAGALAPLPPPRGTAAPGGRGGGARLRRLGRLIHAILFQYKVFHWLKIGSAWIVILFGFLTYLFQESSTYYIWHSIWHIASYTSAALFVLGKPQTYNEGKIAHFLSSGQANREKTGDEGEVKDSDDDDIQLLSSSSSVYHLQQRKKKRYPGSVGRHKFPTMI
uniref:EGF-like domain-containing protein n=1 Tax=Heterosigma akashiwo TaxID=2829 RepID=A0A7S3Y220_HETAK